ncbi:MAG: helix-turn-helix domain-containing protein [OCS116 cluster bacterium]|nr:helix-turn-helix domain-containing protein [OCS116 cluster bacterium]
MNNIQILDIGQVAKQSGLPASTLRYYEEKGLVQSIGRRGLRRLFAANIVQQLALISLGRQAGFSLDDIAQMFAIDGKPQIDRAQLLLKADELDKNIKQLIAMRDGLVHAAQCKAPSHLECPSFQRLLNLASKNRARQRGKFSDL